MMTKANACQSCRPSKADEAGMCGRIFLTETPRALANLFDLTSFPEWQPRYNISPRQTVPVIRMGAAGREAALLRWGLVPSWAKDLKSNMYVNAMSETAATKPSFRAAFRARRCLIPATGFYDWEERGKEKQPWLFRLKESGPLALGGLWERWSKGEEPVETFTILTTEPNDLVKRIKDRMPVIISPDAFSQWLDPDVQSDDALLPLMQPFDAALMTATPVSQYVNNVRHQGPACIEEVTLS
jgi:putative SOS response-associated peptidase YedK